MARQRLNQKGLRSKCQRLCLHHRPELEASVAQRATKAGALPAVALPNVASQSARQEAVSC